MKISTIHKWFAIIMKHSILSGFQDKPNKVPRERSNRDSTLTSQTLGQEETNVVYKR